MLYRKNVSPRFSKWCINYYNLLLRFLNVFCLDIRTFLLTKMFALSISSNTCFCTIRVTSHKRINKSRSGKNNILTRIPLTTENQAERTPRIVYNLCKTEQTHANSFLLVRPCNSLVARATFGELA